MEKSPSARFATAGAMADDLRRYIDDLPILAKRPSVFSRTLKFARRHRALTLGVGLVVALGIASVSLVQLREQKAHTLALKLDRLTKEGVALTDAGNWHDAEVRFRKVLELDANSADAFADLARLRLFEHNRRRNPALDHLLEQAERECLQAIEIQPDHEKAWNTLGVARKKLGKYGEALQAYDRILERQPDAYFALVNKGTLLALLGRLREAHEYLLRSTQVDPHCPYSVHTWRNLGSLQLHLGEKENCLASLQKAIECDPSDVGTKLLEARCVMEEDIERAAEALAVAKHHARHRTNPKLHRLRAQLALQRGDFGQAASQAQQAMDAGDLPVLNHLIIAIAKAKLGQPEDARRAMWRADDAWPAELREPDGFLATANEGVLWIDTTEEVQRLKPEAKRAMGAQRR